MGSTPNLQFCLRALAETNMKLVLFMLLLLLSLPAW
jgi:hypothetical protein